MHYYDSMQELIGHTPLVRLHHFETSPDISIFAKLELYNPSGSVKDRTGLYMIQDAEQKGLLKPGGVIVEATAGNTGLGIAFAALNRGYQIIFVIPDKFSIEKQTLVKALGAKIINTPREYGMLGAVRKAEEIKKEIPGSVSLEQFENQSNPLAHYETTGKEIYEDDIVSLDDGRVGVVSFRGGCFVLECSNRMRQALYDVQTWQMTILGNTFENPELLVSVTAPKKNEVENNELELPEFEPEFVARK